MKAPFCDVEGQTPFQVTGNSMSPTLKHGDIVVIGPDGQPGKGDLVAVKVKLEEGWSGPVVKRFYPDGGGHIHLKPDNPDYEELVLAADDVEIVGVVVKTVTWADERQWCKHAHEGKRPETCSMFGVGEHTPGGFCKLNGYSIEAWGLEAALAMRTPCVFDEPEDAPIWAKVERWRTQEFPLGCLNSEQINSESG
jgi:signal peptidase I